MVANEKKYAQLAGFLCVGNKCVGKNQPIVAYFMLAVLSIIVAIYDNLFFLQNLQILSFKSLISYSSPQIIQLSVFLGKTKDSTS